MGLWTTLSSKSCQFWLHGQNTRVYKNYKNKMYNIDITPLQKRQHTSFCFRVTTDRFAKYFEGFSAKICIKHSSLVKILKLLSYSFNFKKIKMNLIKIILLVLFQDCSGHWLRRIYVKWLISWTMLSTAGLFCGNMTSLGLSQDNFMNEIYKALILQGCHLFITYSLAECYKIKRI